MAAEVKNEYDVRDVETSGEDGSFAKRVRHSISGVDDASSIEGQLFSMNDVDPAMDAKMRLVNNVGELEIGCCLATDLTRPSTKSAGPTCI